MVPISSVWIRGIEEVDIVSGVGYFPSASLPVGSGIRVSEELGVGRGMPEGVRLRLRVVLGSVDIGGPEEWERGWAGGQTGVRGSRYEVQGVGSVTVNI
jgi:hypothetical protein